MSETHNLFISHRHEDDALVSDFKTLMKNKGVTIRDASITSDRPEPRPKPRLHQDPGLGPGHPVGRHVGSPHHTRHQEP